MATGKGKLPTGFATEIALSEASFREAHRVVQAGPDRPTKKRKREGKGDTSTVFGAGSYKGPWARFETEHVDSSSEEEIEVEVEYEEDDIVPQPARPDLAGTAYGDTGPDKETTEFHGSQQYDYQGRTYMHIPQDLNIDLRGELVDHKNYHPKKQIHTWKSHTKPITQMRFFPGSGHLLLSASADSKIKLWDVYHQRELLRTFSGHNKSVVDVDFNIDGTRFLSAAFDNYMKLWDTETGTCISRYSTGAKPHVIRFNPSPAESTQFLAGMHDKKIVQFDTREPGDTKMVQEYDHHLGPVNTITFCDENRRFVTTSDDRSLRAWEYGIPVPIKFIAEPDMFAMNRAAAHPSGKYVAMQSSDNQIVVYGTTEKFRQNRKKGFRGHNVSGYGIDVAISPDGGMVMSGDSGGYLCFWDWKTCKMWHKIQAHDQAVVACAWHPREQSRVVTGGLDGLIKYWD